MVTTPVVPTRPEVASIASRIASGSAEPARVDRVDEDGEGVVGVAAEGRGRLAVGGGVLLDVGRDHRLLRIVVGEEVGDEQRGAGQADALGGLGAGEVDEALRGDAVALVERQADGELLVVAGDDRRALAEAGVEHRLRCRRCS